MFHNLGKGYRLVKISRSQIIFLIAFIIFETIFERYIVGCQVIDIQPTVEIILGSLSIRLCLFVLEDTVVKVHLVLIAAAQPEAQSHRKQKCSIYLFHYSYCFMGFNIHLALGLGSIPDKIIERGICTTRRKSPFGIESVTSTNTPSST